MYQKLFYVDIQKQKIILFERTNQEFSRTKGKVEHRNNPPILEISK